MLAERFKSLRKSKGLTQAELSELLGTSQSQIKRWENGENVPSGDYIRKMAEVFDVTSDYLLGLVDVPHAELSEDDLSDAERRLILLLRNGLLQDALEAFTSISKSTQE